MSLSADDELRRLRARAYGPAADIDSDAAAVQRLRELERWHADRVHAETEIRHEEDVDPAVRELLRSTTFVEGGEPPQVESDTEGASSRPRLPRRIKALWFASVAAAAALAASIAVAVVGILPVSASSGAPQIATLEPTTTVTIPTGWLGATDASLVFEFHDVTLFTFEFGVPDPDRTDATSECLMMLPTAEVPQADEFNGQSSWSFSSYFVHSVCAVGRFPATVEVPLSEDAPEELRAAFPDARALQFVLDGDRVDVFLDDGE